MNLLFTLRWLLFCLGGLSLCLSPFLPWLRLEVMGVHVWIPGFLFHGAWLAAIGALTLLLSLTRWRRLPLILLSLIGLGSRWLYEDFDHIWTRGDYFLAKWQVGLAPLNDMMANVNLTPLEIYHHSNPADRVGEGLYWAGAGLLLLTLGWLLGIALEIRQGSSPLSVLLGSPRCSACRFSITPGMRFCPGCGLNRTRKPSCSRCGGEMAGNFRYCPSCGEGVSSS